MRLVTYNVNSLKARLPRLRALLEEHAPDVVCIQETKTNPDAFPHEELEQCGYVAADHSGGRWEGVAILAKTGLGIDNVVRGLPGEPSPDEARWVEATVGDLRVASTYVPNGRALGTDTFADKLVFLEAVAARARLLRDGPAVIAGDFNVCPTDNDVWDAEQVHGGTHVSSDERTRLAAIAEAGFVDAYRLAEPAEPGFSWWDYRAGHFHKGFGLRIDLVLVAESSAGLVEAAMVDRSYRKPTKVRESKPSDHAPVIVDLRTG